jgi:GT2 family glycosyltransferase
MNPLLTILIPTYRGIVGNQPLKYCIESLLLQTEYPYKIVILNNDPVTAPMVDEFVDGVKQHFPHIKVRHLGGNKGWMGAINAGMQDVDTPFFCMLNDDVVFIPGQKEFWRKLVSLLHGDIAASGPCSNFVMGSQNLFFTNLPSAFQAKFLIGFCMVLRADAFKEVGMLDETLPGGDDLDLSIRLRQAGYTLICEREAYLHHIGSVTGNAVHKGYWNSELQTDRTNNALIRKHGLKAWYELVSGDMLDLAKAPKVTELRNAEEEWVKHHCPTEGRGISVGSGAKKISNELCLDIARPGDTGAGGRKFSGATNDLTGDAANIPVANHSQDYLLGLHIFEHLVDPIAVLNEWKRVLKPDGKLIIVCPNHDQGDTMMIDYTHLHAFTPVSLCRLLRLAGWEVMAVESFAIATFGVVCRPMTPLAAAIEVGAAA